MENNKSFRCFLPSGHNPGYGGKEPERVLRFLRGLYRANALVIFQRFVGR